MSLRQLEAIDKDAGRQGFAELAYEAEVEEGRRHLADKDKNKTYGH
jgi:hypothetical protein